MWEVVPSKDLQLPWALVRTDVGSKYEISLYVSIYGNPLQQNISAYNCGDAGKAKLKRKYVKSVG